MEETVLLLLPVFEARSASTALDSAAYSDRFDRKRAGRVGGGKMAGSKFDSPRDG